MLQVSFGQLPSDLLLGNPWPSASLGELRRHLVGRDAVLHLGVCDGPVLLPQVQPQLAFVAEVQVALLTLQSKKSKGTRRQNHIGSGGRAVVPVLPLRVLCPLHGWSRESGATVGEAAGKLLSPRALTPARHSTLPHSSSLHPHTRQEAVI